MFSSKREIFMAVSLFLIRLDRACDWIPFISTASNLSDLFLRSLPSNYLPEVVTKSRYWTHLEKKSLHCFLFIPILNVFYCLIPFFWTFPPSRKEVDDLIQVSKEIDQDLTNLRHDFDSFRQNRNNQ